MKKVVKSTVITAMIVSSLSAQELSCSDIVSMNEAQVHTYVEQLKNSLDVKNIAMDDIKNEGVYIDKIYKLTAQKNRCLLLREATVKSVENIKRVKALTLLSKDRRLSYNEKALYTNALKSNLQYFSVFSSVSLVSQESSHYPLLYLSADKVDSTTIFVYEKRLVGETLKTFSRKVKLSKQIPMYGSAKREIRNSYLSYLNRQGVQLSLIPAQHDIYNQKLNSAKIEKANLLSEFQYKVIEKFEAVHFINGKIYVLEKGTKVDFEGYNGNEAFFQYLNIRYRVGKRKWNRSTKSLEQGD
jgi:hypothetical protein